MSEDGKIDVQSINFPSGYGLPVYLIFGTTGISIILHL